ncbi:hypothetical protein [Sphingomonas bacterium]|uniref:hypothetical protein n=1 Tax=Sphingomonas bacterium TaxID=1895847 RepID=UPI001576176D|nr:hypothetical protein [Sphingomonas bacterium]
MPVPCGNRIGAAAAVVCAAAGMIGAAPTTSFDTVFTAAGEPPFLHAVVLFAAGGSPHRMELWRDHERRILRTTDARITTLATHTRDAGYDLVVLDRNRRTSTRISRDNLYRMGSFTDWFDLGHGLRHPHGNYRLTPTASAVPATLPATPAPCRWYDLDQPGGGAHICWDARDRLPLLIATAAWVPAWRIVAIDHAAIGTGRFVLDDRGYVRNDADQDVEGD